MNAQQLKNAILQEAIEGRLVPQDPNDEPASALLARIRKEKERLVKEGKLKKKDLEVKPISEDEIPFDIPESWEWVRHNELFEISGGSQPPKSHFSEIKKDGYVRLYQIRDYGENPIPVYIPASEASKMTIKGDILLARYGGSLGKVFFAEEGAYNVAMAKVVYLFDKDLVYQNFLYWYYKGNLYQDLVKGNNRSAQGGFNKDDLSSLLFPLPPLAEQHRIVAKIEELLPKVEEYGKAQEALNKLNEELPERLKKSILQEAITGHLVPQDSNDEPASVLLAKIRKEKEQLVKAGKLKKKDLIETPISEDEIPFDIPDSWEWCRLGDIGIFERGNGIKRDETFESGYPCVRYGEMYTKYKYAPTFEKTVSFTSKAVFEKCRKAHKGDLFMALTGENKQDISLAAQYVGDEEIAVGGDLCHFTVLEAYGLYFVYLINSTYFSSKKEILATGDIIVHISTDKLASIPIPLPPLAEQHRIVEKLEQVLGEIDKLKK